MRVAVLVLDGVFDLGLAAVLDTLALASALGGGEGPPIEVERIGVRRRVHTAQGLTVPVSEPPRRRPDVLLLPALGATTPEGIAAALERPDVADAQALMVRWAARGTTICAACGGTFLLAATSLLDGGVATTTWWLAADFRARFPDVELDETRMVVVSGGCVTAGAALAHLDLALWLVRQHSPALATLVARYLVVEPRVSRSVHAIPDHLAHADPIVEGFERWAREALSEPFSLDDAARSVGTSPRTLARRTRRVLGKSPVAYVQALRVERAVHLLRTTDATVDAIAADVGYQSAVTLRSLLRRETGCGVRELRARDWVRDAE
ncbi:MAG: helix-turn-helix domain-containing protein [Sandaracinaceae bacterium]|nr:helix-turn-helix domain-containing protein [Sandaracinaceae bacterium]